MEVRKPTEVRRLDCDVRIITLAHSARGAQKSEGENADKIKYFVNEYALRSELITC